MNLLWLQSGGCGGCTMSLLCHDAGDVTGTLRAGGIELLWHPSLSEQTGAEALELLEACAEGRHALDILCIEGALLRGPAGSGRFHMLAGTGRPMIDWARRLAARARHVVAVGSCAAFGGMTSSGANPTDACGLQYDGEQAGGLLGADWRAPDGLPVINVAGCPTHPGWVVETLLGAGRRRLHRGRARRAGRPALLRRPAGPPRLPAQRVLRVQGQRREASDQGCLMENLGCKGTQAHADCNTRLWNGAGSCLRGGYACIRLHRARLRGARPPLRRDAQGGRHPHRPAHRHAQGLVRRAGGAVEIGHAASACARTPTPTTRWCAPAVRRRQ
jgi:Ni,Fe-hydrogenase I small subunit